ncbi:MAG: DNA polymerase/3'-5' exonuclease PolX [Coriobacteriia bacterium]|nr:DNA polymerase/3'-5' exonuclease PolX [Coriobacteriia bacterium]
MPEFDNAAVASMLDTMGDLLEVSGADKFRFLSYHKAANSIRAYPEPLSALAAEGRLTDVPGIGVKLAASIAEIFDRGTFPEFEQVKSEFAPGIIRVMEVPGVGPKRARLLYDELQVTSVEDLEEALAAGRLEGLPGFGAKTIENVAAGIERAKAHHERILLMDALPLAERMAEELRRLPGVVHAEPAGSIRRMQETIGDIDILVAAEDPSAVMEQVRSLPMVVRVLGSGGTKTSVLAASGLQVDVRAVSPETWGAALQYFTGNKDHNVRVREVAKRAGLKVSEYGVFRVETGERIAGATEEEVYAALGMATPPPEYRLGSSEVVEALEHRLPRLVELGDIRGELHAHTTSTDSRSSVEENREKAARLGYEYVAVTDHAYELRMVRGLSVEQLEEQWALIDAVNGDGCAPRVLKGIELNIADDGSVDYAPEVLARFDICLASIHAGMRQPRKQLTDRLLRAMENPYVDVISHLTGRILGRRDPMDLDLDALFAKAAESGTILEINSYPDRLDLTDAHIRAASRLGVRFCLGTDAHSSAHMDFMSYGVAIARRAGLTPDDLLNCQPLDGVPGWLKRSRIA